MINLENLIANRLGGTSFGKEDKIYKFEKIKRANEADHKNLLENMPMKIWELKDSN